MRSHTKIKGLSSVAGLIILVVCLAGSLLLLLNRERLIDQTLVWQYEPSAAIEQIADKASMSEEGTFYFYASQPVIEASQKFNAECERKEEHSAILGCYTNRRIYIFDVQNEQLAGIEEVTAAHEMLHAAWDRLSQSERDRLIPLLETTYDKLENDELKERMDYYERTQPGERSNELHSIFGTEFKDIGKDLEEHFARYFEDRAEIVALHDKYNQLFQDLERRSQQLVTELNTIGDAIDQLSKQYNNKVKQLNADVSSFNRRADSGVFSSKGSFDSERADLVSRTASLEKLRNNINGKIDRYEKLRQELQAINARAAVLTRSIDSTLAPAPELE